MKKLILLVAAAALLLPVVGLASSDGEAVYKKACGVCHDNGIAGAPKTGDKAAWGGLVSEGVDALTATAIKGQGAMPAKGGHAELSDAEVKAAVEYMVEESK